MSRAILELRRDHGNIAKLLDLLDEHVARSRSGERVDYEIIKSILDYCLIYPDLCHHPKEDLVFEKLSARDRTHINAINDLLAEHEKLAALTEGFSGLIRKILLGGVTREKQFESVAREFLESYRRHIAEEENVIFPAAMQALTAEDWAEIEFEIFDRTDPLFSDDVENRFEALCEQIMRTPTIISKVRF